MRVRQRAFAFIFNPEGAILFQRDWDHVIQDFITPPRDHLKECEWGEPEPGCMRIIHEQTKSSLRAINNLHLKYILMKQSSGIEISYIFFCSITNYSDEIGSGSNIRWIDPKKINRYKTSSITQEVIKHYLKFGHLKNNVYLGTVKPWNHRNGTHWLLLKDWTLPILGDISKLGDKRC